MFPLDDFTTELAILDSHVDELVSRTQKNEQKLSQLQEIETDFYPELHSLN